jgi:hypothetical protein
MPPITVTVELASDRHGGHRRLVLDLPALGYDIAVAGHRRAEGIRWVT